MIEERAVVTEVHDGAVTVVAGAKQGCPTCAQGRGCAGGVLGRLANRKQRRVRAANPQKMDVSAGDLVLIGLDESALVRGAALVYLMPLLALIVAAGVAQLLGAGEGVTTLVGGLALVAGFAVAAATQRAPDAAHRYAPRLLRRASLAEACNDTASRPA